MSHLVGQNGLSATGSQQNLSHNFEPSGVKNTLGLLTVALGNDNGVDYHHVGTIGKHKW